MFSPSRRSRNNLFPFVVRTLYKTAARHVYNMTIPASLNEDYFP